MKQTNKTKQTRQSNQYNNTYVWQKKTYTSYRKLWSTNKQTLMKHGVRLSELKNLLNSGVTNIKTLKELKELNVAIPTQSKVGASSTRQSNQYNNTYVWQRKTYTSYRKLWSTNKQTLMKHGVRLSELKNLLNSGVTNIKTLKENS